jgi:hypothetical protein
VTVASACDLHEQCLLPLQVLVGSLLRYHAPYLGAQNAYSGLLFPLGCSGRCAWGPGAQLGPATVGTSLSTYGKRGHGPSKLIGQRGKRNQNGGTHWKGVVRRCDSWSCWPMRAKVTFDTTASLRSARRPSWSPGCSSKSRSQVMNLSTWCMQGCCAFTMRRRPSVDSGMLRQQAIVCPTCHCSQILSCSTHRVAQHLKPFVAEGLLAGRSRQRLEDGRGIWLPADLEEDAINGLDALD